MKATTSSRCHPEPSLVSESKFNRPEGYPVNGPEQSTDWRTVATTPRGVLMLGMREDLVAVAWDMGKLQWH